MSKEKEIVSINGETYPISQCRKFDKGYYLIGKINIENSGDCYFIDGKYYRNETDQVVFDHETLKYMLKNENLIQGVTGFKDKEPVMGYFTKTDKNVIITLEDGQKVYIKDLSLLSDQKQFRERLTDGNFYHINSLPASQFSRIAQPTTEYKTSLPYDSGGVLKDYMQQYDKLDVQINQNVEFVTPLFGNLSFGLEFETTAGFIPDRILKTTGLIPLRDGSIPGIEYVTVPMSGAKGIQTVMNAVKELNYRTKYDNSCALHMHIGNVPRTPEFILAMFRTTCAIQNEMYEMFPLYKKYNFRVKNKNYSKPYPVYELLNQLDPVITKSNLNNNFDILYSYLSMGEPFGIHDFNLNNVKNHPSDREGRAKWNIRTRYYLNNLIPLIFGNKQTIEFRIHTATLDTNKIMYFMLMNSLLVNFVIKNTKTILEDPRFLINIGGLQNMLGNEILTSPIKSSTYRDFIYSKFVGYMKTRKEITESDNSRGDIIGNEDKFVIQKPIDWISVEIPSEVMLDEVRNTKMRSIEEDYQKVKNSILSDHGKRILSGNDAKSKLDRLEVQRRDSLERLKQATLSVW